MKKELPMHRSNSNFQLNMGESSYLGRHKRNMTQISNKLLKAESSRNSKAVLGLTTSAGLNSNY